MQTADGANILVTAKGHVPFDYVVFETGSDKYAWLNTVVAVGVGRQMDGAVAMDVFQVIFSFPFLAPFSTEYFADPKRRRRGLR